MTAETHTPVPKDQLPIRRKLFAVDTPKGDRIRVGVTFSDSFEGTPLLVAPGWSNGTHSMASFAAHITAASNVPVVTLDHSRSRSNYDPEERKRDSLRAAITHGLKQLSIPDNQFDIFAYSEGNINGLMLAEQDETGRVRAFTAHAPAGVTERSYAQVISGATGEILRLLHPRHHEYAPHLGKQALVSALYVASNPLLALRESYIAATMPAADKLGELAEHIPVGVSAGTHDGFFPADSVWAGTPKNITARYEYDGNHTDILYRSSIQQDVWGFHQKHSSRPAA